MIKSGEKTNSDALTKNVAGWAIEYDILLNLRRQGIETVGVYVKDTGDKYITDITNFLEQNSKLIQPKNKNSGLRRFLPISFFSIQLGATKLK